MKKINKEIFLGVIIILISLVIFINLFNSYSSNKSNNVSFSLNSDFNNVGSLSVGNDIKIHGVKVGEVANISINPELLVANVIIEFDNFYKIPSDSIFTITSNGLMGGSYINIKIGSSELIFTENETTKYNIDAISIENIISDIIFTD
ncbi:MlaD family protein [Alphaproteobacteria bacterium]|nr:MlaD family protein [Alphaproteobacteria bacterium]